MLTQAYLQEILHYSIITGQFHWLKPRSGIKISDIVGWFGNKGYRYIEINGKSYRAHRLAWFYITGEWPQNEIDHKNGVKDANQWINIREATRSQNLCNTGMPSTNTSGYKGVSWNKAIKKWQAYIVLNGKRKHLGYFNDIEPAYAARLKSEKELHGDFARAMQ